MKGASEPGTNARDGFWSPVMLFVIGVLSMTVIASVITIILAVRSASVSQEEGSVDRFAIVQEQAEDAESVDD